MFSWSSLELIRTFLSYLFSIHSEYQIEDDYILVDEDDEKIKELGKILRQFYRKD